METDDRQETQLLNLLPIDELVRSHRPNLNPDDVKRLLLALIAPGSDRPHFGDHTIGYHNLRNMVIGRVSPEAFDECFDWLTKPTIWVIADVRGGTPLSRRRGRNTMRCALNMKYKQASPVGGEIIKISLRARQELERLSGGSG
jgi:hypothetical protein